MIDYGEAIEETLASMDAAESQAAETESSEDAGQAPDDGEQEEKAVAAGDEVQGEEEGEEKEEAEGETSEQTESETQPKGVQKRIDELTRQRYDAERQTEQLLSNPESYRKAFIEKNGYDPFGVKPEAEMPEDEAAQVQASAEAQTPYDEDIAQLEALIEEDNFYSDIEKVNTQLNLKICKERRDEFIGRQKAEVEQFEQTRQKQLSEAVTQFHAEVKTLTETFGLKLDDKQIANLRKATGEVGRVADAELHSGKRKEPIPMSEAVETAAKILFFDEMASAHVRSKVRGKVNAQKEQMASTGGDNVRNATDVTPAQSYEDAIDLAIRQHK
jgi:hypothetical protein